MLYRRYRATVIQSSCQQHLLCSQHISQPFHHFHRVIGFDIIIRDLLHLFPGVSLMASLLFGMLVLTRTPYCRGKENGSHIIKALCTPKRCRVSLKDTSSLSTERNSRLWLHQSKLTQNLSIGFTAANCRTSRPTVEFPSLFVLFQCEPRTKRKLAAKLLHEDRETNNTPSHLPSSSFCKRRLSSANEIFVDSENGGALGFSCKAMVVSCR